MNRRPFMTIAILVIFASFTATPGSAQDGSAKFGIGIGVSSTSFGNLETLLVPSVYLPILAGDQLMVEPSLGLLRTSSDDASETLLSIGAGLLFLMEPSSDGRVYVGPRVGILRFSQSFGSDSDSESNLTVSGVLGGEYLLRPMFSLGGEAGIKWIDVSEGSVISTVTEFRVRWYFQ